MDNSRLHERARTTGVNPIVYWLMRAWLQPFAHIYWRLSRIGREHVPTSGPVIFVCNHRSFIDPFIVGLLTRRPVYYVAKQELFGYNRLLAWLISNLGAFPVRRGEGDADFVETAKAILERGDPLLIFPEGTRTRPGALGKPKRGVGRLALETGATVVPVAMIGTEGIRNGFRIRPRKIRVRIGAPLTFPMVDVATSQLAAAVTDRIWPNVMLQWEWLGGLPPIRRAKVIGTSAYANAITTMLAKGGIDTKAAEEPDLVVFAVPAADLPKAVEANPVTDRTGVLAVANGLVPPLGALPSSFLQEQTLAWGVGVIAGDALDPEARITVASGNEAFVRQVIGALNAAGVKTARKRDVVGTELAALTRDAILAPAELERLVRQLQEAGLAEKAQSAKAA
jgi:1-acyl-sn-glycerol-3-phosphate acyltransferase